VIIRKSDNLRVKTALKLISAVDKNERMFITKHFTELDWLSVLKEKSYRVFKLTTANDANTIQGLLCIEILPPILIVALETADFNRNSITNTQLYQGVGTEMLAHACQLSFDYGFSGDVILESKIETKAFYRDLGGKEQMGTNFFIFNGEVSENLIAKL
jgi:hypothetical protein